MDTRDEVIENLSATLSKLYGILLEIDKSGEGLYGPELYDIRQALTHYQTQKSLGYKSNDGDEK